ncbi:hypothetical protein FA15DRAFT_708601 [Coprinopsis marcescibilis]|uniref:Uncharacterized protein n=1 Tax=Coprinopsis marcescibilis TaxID=230819 RepID=A0A5C3KI03_COPMA|nr:hypothetical protein FA15DRAFT_708601 [Coprinopsis marcescibilis]
MRSKATYYIYLLSATVSALAVQVSLHESWEKTPKCHFGMVVHEKHNIKNEVPHKIHQALIDDDVKSPTGGHMTYSGPQTDGNRVKYTFDLPNASIEDVVGAMNQFKPSMIYAPGAKTGFSNRHGLTKQTMDKLKDSGKIMANDGELTKYNKFYTVNAQAVRDKGDAETRKIASKAFTEANRLKKEAAVASGSGTNRDRSHTPPDAKADPDKSPVKRTATDDKKPGSSRAEGHYTRARSGNASRPNNGRNSRVNARTSTACRANRAGRAAERTLGATGRSAARRATRGGRSAAGRAYRTAATRGRGESATSASRRPVGGRARTPAGATSTRGGNSAVGFTGAKTRAGNTRAGRGAVRGGRTGVNRRPSAVSGAGRAGADRAAARRATGRTSANSGAKRGANRGAGQAGARVRASGTRAAGRGAATRPRAKGRAGARGRAGAVRDAAGRPGAKGGAGRALKRDSLLD